MSRSQTSKCSSYLQKLRTGDKVTWQSLIIDYALEVRNGILASMRKRGISENHADEIEQRVWLRCFEKRKKIKVDSDPQKLGHWLRKTSFFVVQEFMYELRCDTEALFDADIFDKHDEHADDSISEIENYDDQNISPEDEVIVQEINTENDAYIHEAIEQVLIKSHQDIMKFLLQGKTPQEIANACNVELNTVYKIRRTSISKIRGYMAMKGIEVEGRIL
jgi:DNA-directed RNA polymerase specialized sigma24 family protein